MFILISFGWFKFSFESFMIIILSTPPFLFIFFIFSFELTKINCTILILYLLIWKVLLLCPAWTVNILSEGTGLRNRSDKFVWKINVCLIKLSYAVISLGLLIDLIAESCRMIRSWINCVVIVVSSQISQALINK